MLILEEPPQVAKLKDYQTRRSTLPKRVVRCGFRVIVRFVVMFSLSQGGDSLLKRLQ